MAVCDCCGRDKSDVKIRVDLRGVDHRGYRTAKPFHGPLCNDCLAKTGRFRSAEQRWLLHQIMHEAQKVTQRAQIGQRPTAKPRRGMVVPLRPLPAKPVEPRRH
jgi:hypothetical protein